MIHHHPFFTPPGGGDSVPSAALLQELAERAADLLPARICSILLFDPLGGGHGARLTLAAHSGGLPDAASGEGIPAIAFEVAASGRPLLVSDITHSPYLPMARRPEEENPGFLSVPIFFEGKVAGTLNASHHPGGASFDQRNLLLAETIARHVGSILENTQLENVLRSRLLQAALARTPKGGSRPEQPLRGAAAEQLATRVAKTFYREMMRAGFGTDQIIRAATEILSLLGERVRKHRVRQNRVGSGPRDEGT